MNLDRVPQQVLAHAYGETCDRAIEIIGESADATRWRDYVVDQGRALRMYDFEILQRHHDREAAARKQERHREKSLRLHGIVTAVVQ